MARQTTVAPPSQDGGGHQVCARSEVSRRRPGPRSRDGVQRRQGPTRRSRRTRPSRHAATRATTALRAICRSSNASPKRDRRYTKNPGATAASATDAATAMPATPIKLAEHGARVMLIATVGRAADQGAARRGRRCVVRAGHDRHEHQDDEQRANPATVPAVSAPSPWANVHDRRPRRRRAGDGPQQTGDGTKIDRM